MKQYLDSLIKKGFEQKRIIQCMEYRFPYNFEFHGNDLYITESNGKYFKV